MEIENIKDGCVLPLPYKYSKYLFCSSFLMSGTALVTLYYDDGVTSLYYFLLFLTSINFWRRPEHGFRRQLDQVLVYSGCLYVFYNVFLVLNTEFQRVTFISLFLSVLLFDLAEIILCYLNSTKWIVFHMAIHLYVSIMGFYVLLI
jgi:hypothetical protein